MRYQNVYWSAQKLREESTTADIIAIGDSWFWYPFPGGSLINSIGDLVAPLGHNILAVGNNGAEVYDYVNGKYKSQVKELLRLYGSAASALLVSGGGNDFAGLNDLRPLLLDTCIGAASAPECFKGGDGEGTIGFLMQRVFENYAILISRALFVLPPTALVYVHCYDYAIPTGQGVFANGSGWLKPALDDARVPAKLQADCVRFVIDRLHDTLGKLCASSAGRVKLLTRAIS